MIGKKWMSAAALLGLLGLSAPSRGNDEAKVKVEDLPAAVLKAAKAMFPDAKIRGASKEVDDGETMYEVEMTTAEGQDVDLAIDPDGEVEAVEKVIPAEDLPAAVLKAAKATFPKGKIAKVEEITEDDDKVTYSLTIQIVADGQKVVEILFAPNGKIIDDEDDDDAKAEEKPEG